MANNKEPYILLSLYETLYKEKYNKPCRLNKFREKWAMQDVIDSVGFDRTKELLIYYFKTSKSGHPISFFFYNFDKMDDFKTQLEKDFKNRRALLEATKKLVEGGEE